MRGTGKILAVVFCGAWVFCASRSGATVYNSDGSAASVQALHDIASNGDTITMPAGTFTWDVQVHLTKNITLQGAGQDATIIYDNVPKVNNETSVALYATGITGNFRMTDFTVRGQAQDTSNYNKGEIVVNGTSHTVRIDHITIDQPGTGAIHVKGAWGVVDHCYFNEPNAKNGVDVQAVNYGDESFETPVNLGSGEGVYIEDCTFVGNGAGGTTAMNPVNGGRVAFRHNTLIDQNTGGHGTEGSRQRGMRSYEIYQNTFTTSHMMDKGIQLRGGTGVIWGNTLQGTGGTTGYKNCIVGLNFRSFTTYNNNNFGSATGTNPWDENSDTTGYACLDQVGTGLCLDAIRNNPAVNQRTGGQAWPTQQREPVYVWGNTWTPVPNNPGNYIGTNGPSPSIQVGRDMIDLGDTPLAGYTPFTYPHPLTNDPGPSPTPTATATFTPTPKPTPTATATFTPTPTATATFTPTATYTPTPTATATFTPTPTSTPLPSPTPTLTPTPHGHRKYLM